MTAENGLEGITITVKMVVIFLGGEKVLLGLEFVERLLLWLPKS